MNDDVERRAAEIKKQNEAARAAEDVRDRDWYQESQRLHTRYLAALAGRTQYPVETTPMNCEDRIGFRVCFWFYSEGKSLALDVAELGVSNITGPEDGRAFEYYISPADAALRISYPKIDGALSVSNGPQGEVLAKAVEMSFEMMAHVVASGGEPGSIAEIRAKVGRFTLEKHTLEREAKRERDRVQRTGCLVALGIFLGLSFLLGLLNK